MRPNVQAIITWLALVFCLGTPSTLSAQNSNHIIIRGASSSGNQLELFFSSFLASNSYSVVKADDVASPVWQPANGFTVSQVGPGLFVVRLPNPAGTQEFYRVVGTSHGPDLSGVFGAVSFPTELVAGIGGNGSVALVVLNQGNVAVVANQAIDVRLAARSLNGAIDFPLFLLTNQFVGSLSPGRSRTLNFNLTFPTNLPVGNYRIAATIDAANVVPERFEDNNVVIDPIARHVAAPFTDLFTRIKLIDLAALIRGGDAGRATVTLGNAGNVLVAGMIDLDIFASCDTTLDQGDILLGVVTNYLILIPARKATDLRLNIRFPITMLPDTYHLIARVSPQNGITDTNLANNVFIDAGVYDLRQESNLEDFRMFSAVGRSWDYESSTSTTLSGGFGSVQRHEFSIDQVRVDALFSGPSNETRVVVSRGGKDVAAMDWQTDTNGTKQTGRANRTGVTDFDFSVDNLYVAPAGFDPRLMNVYTNGAGFRGYAVVREGNSTNTLYAEGEARSKVRLLGFEDVLLQSGKIYENALKFELSFISTSTVAIVIEGDPIPLAGYTFNDVQTSWAVRDVGVVKSVADVLIDITRAGPPLATIRTHSVAELVEASSGLAQALDGPGLRWFTPSGLGWYRQEEDEHDGTDAAQSGSILDSQKTVMQTTVTGPGSLTFWWKVSSEEDYDFLRFFLDGLEEKSISGEVSWTQSSQFIPAGRHTLQWAYEKDEQSADGVDAGWVDQVSFIPDMGPPYIGSQPYDQSVTEGDLVTFDVTARGQWPFTYQWYKNGALLAGATNESLMLPNAQTNDSGSYHVVVHNSEGSTNSDTAILTVIRAITLGEAVDNTELDWTVFGHAAWMGQTAETHDGIDAARSGRINDGFSGIQTAVTGPGILTFWWKVSAEEWDSLQFSNGSTRLRIYGAIPFEEHWEEVPSVFVPAGPQILSWVYWKHWNQGDESEGEDAGWLDQVGFVPDSGPPIVISQPESQTVTEGMPVTLAVQVRGAWPFNFQWQKNGMNLTGATNETYIVFVARTNDAGAYRVKVGNSFGSIFSNPATFTVRQSFDLADALDTTGLKWIDAGYLAWGAQTNITHDGVDAAQSGRISHNQDSSMETTITGPGQLTFFWKVSCEDGFDSLQFFLDDNFINVITGDVPWTEVPVSILPGPHSIRWVFWKDGSDTGAIGMDAGWVDQVTFQPTPAAARLSQPNLKD